MNLAHPVAYADILAQLAPHTSLPHAAEHAARFYLLAESLGWVAARQTLSRRTYYRHRKLYRLADLPVPSSRQANPWNPNGGDTLGFADILTLPHRRFRVVKGFGDPHPTKPRLRLHHKGVQGNIEAVQFRLGKWEVWVDFDHIGSDVLPLSDFLKHCQPLEAGHA